jgi:hypothetical protein
MKWTLVRCVACGSHYTARLLDGEFRLTTDDGDCPCGSDRFDECGKRVQRGEADG